MTVKGKKPGAGFAHLVPSVDELAAITQQAVLVNAPVPRPDPAASAVNSSPVTR